MEASVSLRKQLIRQIAEAPAASHFIIAHSHGGNVAIYALGTGELDGKVKGIVCLNTPFMNVTRRSHAQPVSTLFTCSTIVLAIIGLATIFSVRNVPQLPFVNQLLQVIAGMTLVVASLVLFRFRPIVTHWVTLRQELLMGILRLPKLGKAKVYCFWSASDEIFALFSLTEALSILPYIVLHPFVLIGSFCSLFYLFSFHFETWLAWFGPKVLDLSTSSSLYENIAAAVVIGASIATSVLLGWVPYTLRWHTALTGLVIATLQVAVLVTGALLVALVGQTIGRLLPMGIPLYRFADSLFVRISSTQVPVTVAHIEFFDLGSGSSLFMHSSIYDDPLVIDTIRKILRADTKDVDVEVGSTVA